MALKDTISKWHESICYLDEKQYSMAIQSFHQIYNPSAKIVFNLGCVCLFLEEEEKAIEYFCDSITKDRYLVIAYFLRGVCYCRQKRFDLAKTDFSGIIASMPNDSINYKQLGASVSLDITMIKEWSKALEHVKGGSYSFPPLYPIMDCIFRPPKKMVASLKKEDFLGKAKVISSVQESDIIYAGEKKANNTVIPPRPSPPITPSVRSSQLQQRGPQPQQQRPVPTARVNIPPPPRRKPPRCTDSMKERSRRQWKSMELLSDGQSDNSSCSNSNPRNSSSGPLKFQSPVNNLGNAIDDQDVTAADYSRLSQNFEDSTDFNDRYQPINAALSTSCPHIIKIQPEIKRLIVPPRPKPVVVNKAISNTNTISSSKLGSSHALQSEISKQLASRNGGNGGDRLRNKSTDSPSSSQMQIKNECLQVPVSKPHSSSTSEPGEASAKSVIARAHPSLFQGVPSPSPLKAHLGAFYKNVGDEIQGTKNCHGDRRSPEKMAVRQKPPLPGKPGSAARAQRDGGQVGSQSLQGHKPSRPPPPKFG